MWAAFGDVDNYVEPFAGSLAVLLERPDWHNGVTETVNDADQFLSNFWRALSHAPDEVARYADHPVNEADLFSRHLWLVNTGAAQMRAGMDADPDWFDAKIAGWWLWGICSWIGSGWCSGSGPWTLDNAGQGVNRQLPHLSDAGKGVKRKLPHLSDAGKGVKRKLPHLGDAGKGVNRKLPHLGDAGKGVNRKRPHLGDAGQGVKRKLPHLGDAGQGDSLIPRNEALYEYMRQLAARLHYVRVCCGDWERVVTNGALDHGATVGVFLDPPYSDAADRYSDLYNVDSLDIAHDVRRWCIANGDNPRYRIVYCDYGEAADEFPSTWRMASWKAGSSFGTANSKNGINRHKERLWLSPYCLRPTPQLFDLALGD